MLGPGVRIAGCGCQFPYLVDADLVEPSFVGSPLATRIPLLSNTDVIHMTDTHRLELDWSVEPRLVRPIIRELLLITALIVGMQLGFVLPGTNHPLFDTTVTGDDIILGVGTIGVVASLIHGAPNWKQLIWRIIIAPTDIKDNAGRIGYALVLFIAVLVAHYGFAPMLSPVVTVPWLYDLIFLLIALLPLGSIVYRFYEILDPLSAAITTSVVTESAQQSVRGLDTEAPNQE